MVRLALVPRLLEVPLMPTNVSDAAVARRRPARQIKVSDANARTQLVRRIAISVVDGDKVKSLVLPDTVVSAILGRDVNEVAEALTVGASTDSAFMREGGQIVDSVAREQSDHSRSEDNTDSTNERSALWLRIATQALAVGLAGLGNSGSALAATATPGVIDALIENEELRLTILNKIRALGQSEGALAPKAKADGQTRTQVTLHSATGDFIYGLPMSVNDTFSSSEVGEILSPTGKGLRTIAKKRRDANMLLGVKVGNQYRYPKFQFDVPRRMIIPVIAYANQEWESSADPWGTLEWWYSPEDSFGDHRPIDLVAAGKLTTKMIDEAVARMGVGMD